MHNPPHPGLVLKDTCLEPLGLSLTEAASGLGVSRNQLSRLINCRGGISPDTAVRLAKAFGGTPESWLALQSQYDLWHAQQLAKKNAKMIHVKRFYRRFVEAAEATGARPRRPR